MSYQVLARKWRPQGFSTLIGQGHVVKALSHALTSQRLHHAYLFTGTRGVGKTTLSRILAKSLNCETGVTATPCGVCSACTDIDAGVFTDYIEMDAASNRGVEDMTALLDRAAYAPARGRFKIYMIDEVHMLSNTAFNAMLKTLEEPPVYLKFILATTDPQKIPVTVLSRCLQFSLKPMTVEQVSDYLTHVMVQEAVPADPLALASIAKAAQGSMRDALSILDQAIAHGAGQVTAQGVRDMLGVADTSGIYQLLACLAQRDMAGALAQAQSLLDAGVPASNVLDEIANIASRLAVHEHAGANASELSDPALAALLGQFSAEHLHLLYGIALKAQQEVAYAPNAYAGLAMPLLRMQVFAPSNSAASSAVSSAASMKVSTAANPAAPNAALSGASKPLMVSSVAAVLSVPAPPQAVSSQAISSQAISSHDLASKPPQSQPIQAKVALETARAVAPVNSLVTAPAQAQASASPVIAPAPPVNTSSFVLTAADQWPAIANGLPLMSLARMAARESACTRVDGLSVYLNIPSQHLAAKEVIARVQEALRSLTGKAFTLHTVVVEASTHALAQTASAQAHGEQAKAQSQAEQAFANDPLVKGFVSLGAHIVPGSVRPVAG